jgi:hypothetical protein
MTVLSDHHVVTRTDTTVTVTDSQGLDAELALTVFADARVTGPRTVAVSLPGGGYARGYFDINHPALEGEGQAEYHAERGWVFLSFDTLGSGESRVKGTTTPDFSATVRVHHDGMSEALRLLRNGTLIDELGPVEIARVVGVGHSLGGMQIIGQQGLHQTFDAVAILAFSAIHTVVPSEHGVIETHDVDSITSDKPVDEAWAGPLVDEPSHFSYAFFWDDIPQELITADLGVGFPVRTADVLPAWVSRTFPSFASVGMSRGVVKQEAALIESPVFIAAAERDVIADLRSEPTAYPRSPDISLFEIPKCAHMHNFSVQRFSLWDRLHAWAESLTAQPSDHTSQ